MKVGSVKSLISGLVGDIEVAVDAPETPIGMALVAHPHPLFGGTMDNKVTQTLARTLTDLGYISVRTNFRGVGKTSGEHDYGVAETLDLMHVIKRMKQEFSQGLPLVLAGFSFGSFVQSRVAQELLSNNQTVQRMIMVGTAVGKWEIASVPSNSIVIHGELDDTIPLVNVMRWAEPLELPVTVIAGADHFFHRRLHMIKQIIVQQW